MKRICIILDKPNIGGVGYVTSSLAAELSKKYEVHIVFLMNNDKVELSDCPIYNFKNKNIRVVKFLDKEYALRPLRKLSKNNLKKYINENNIDAAILQTYYAGFAASTLRYTTKAKLIYCEHCSAIHFKNTPKKDTLCQFFSSLFSHKTVALTETTRKEYIKKFHLPKKKVCTIHNWLDLSAPHSGKYDINSKMIISAGRIAEEKGFDNLIEAFSIVHKEYPDWQLHIFGDGYLMNEMKDLVKELNLSENIMFPGMVSDLQERYKDYSMYVMSSKREGMPVVLLEAKLNRLPLISYDIFTGPSEIIRNGTDGFLVPSGDIDELANAMIKLIENKELRQQMSDNSQDNLTDFSKETIIKQWIDLIEDLT